MYGRRDTAAFIALSMPWSNASNVTDFIRRVFFRTDNISGIVVGDVLITLTQKATNMSNSSNNCFELTSLLCTRYRATCYDLRR